MLAFLLFTQLWAKCYTLQDVKDAQCQVLCVRDDHTGGRWITKSCVCFDVQDEGYLDGAVILGVRHFVPEEEHLSIHNEN